MRGSGGPGGEKRPALRCACAGPRFSFQQRLQVVLGNTHTHQSKTLENCQPMQAALDWGGGLTGGEPAPVRMVGLCQAEGVLFTCNLIIVFVCCPSTAEPSGGVCGVYYCTTHVRMKFDTEEAAEEGLRNGGRRKLEKNVHKWASPCPKGLTV